ncbi:PQQ-dependent sugar dehydrogenase [Streptomyces sp. NPDC088725]|uniref:PQQ-dependent sugar dehydrogenase n=1 Tax=Streptomyces sp. NPDC088725 TaxID=3365873 RepID=UPI0037FF1A06
MQRTAMAAVCAAAALLVATGCSSGGGLLDPGGRGSTAPDTSAPASEAAPGPSAAPAKGSVTVTSTVTTGLGSPWSLAELPGGDALVSSRDKATILRVDARSGKKTVVGSVPGVAPAGEGGLLGIALSPSYATDHMVYAYFTTASDNRIARMRYDETKPAGERLGAPDTILRGIPKAAMHNGGRIAFGPDRMLYAGTGDATRKNLAQDKKSPAGKILRMTPEGQPAPGNPEANSVVYSLGHRDVQGLAWDSGKRLWASEFGDHDWDELNLIEPGKNYGWPLVEGKAHKPGLVDPVVQWRPSEASPSGLAYARGSLWMAALRGERLWRIPLAGRETSGAPQAFLTGKYGRLRAVLSLGGDRVWLLTSNTDGRGTPKPGDDRILQLDVS